jgi:hypothetical protein
MTDTERSFGVFFGDAWPSGICDEGKQVPTPVGELCEMCAEPICEDDRGSFVGSLTGEEGTWVPRLAPVHRECSLRSALGGIGHLQNHAYWCGEMSDPDGGRGYRTSALMVWDWVAEHGFTTGPEP